MFPHIVIVGTELHLNNSVRTLDGETFCHCVGRPHGVFHETMTAQIRETGNAGCQNPKRRVPRLDGRSW